jgi:hypothetical protein
MKHISTHIKKKVAATRETERGELMQYFREQLNKHRIRDGFAPLSMGRMGKALQAIPTKDLYYLKKVCDDAPNFSKRFWWELDPKKHTEEAKAKAAKALEARNRERDRGARG